MKTTLPLMFSLLVSPLVFAAEEREPVPVDSLAEAFEQGQVRALLRYSAQHRNSNLHVLQDSATPDIPDEKKQQYSALGGYLGFTTAPWFNTSAGVTFYTSNPVGNNPDDRRAF